MAPTKLAQSLPLPGRSARRRREREVLRICNRDETTAYDVEIAVRQAEEWCHRGEYRLRPRQAGSSMTVLSAGEYTVTAAIADDDARAVVTVSDAPSETVFVAVRDGRITVSKGVP